MPFVLWPVAGAATPIASLFVSWALLGTEDIGVQVEEPFDVLPLFQYVNGIAATTDGLVKDAELGRIAGGPPQASYNNITYQFLICY